MTKNRNKIQVDLEDMEQQFRPSVVENTFVPQQKQDPESGEQKITTAAAIHPLSLKFSRADLIDPAVYTEFKEEGVYEPSVGEIMKGWGIVVVIIGLMSLGLLSYKRFQGNSISISLNISLMFCVSNIAHGLLERGGYWNSVYEDNKFQVKPILQASILKVIRLILTAFLIQRTLTSYVSLQLGYSSHVALFILLLKDNQIQNKTIFILSLLTIIPIAFLMPILTTFVGILNMLVYFRLQLLKERPLVSSLSWLICSSLLFLISFIFSILAIIQLNFDWIITFVFIFLSSKVAKQFLLTEARKCYISQQKMKAAFKLVPILFCCYEGLLNSSYSLFLSISVLGNMVSEYTSKIEDDSDYVVFT